MKDNFKVPRGFRSYLSKSKDLVKDNEKLASVLESAASKLGEQKSKLNRIGGELETLIRLAKAFVSGRYRQIPVQSVIMVAAALLYFLNPFDLINDWLPVIGFLDDATVIAFVFNAVKKDLSDFSAWENKSDHS